MFFTCYQVILQQREQSLYSYSNKLSLKLHSKTATDALTSHFLPAFTFVRSSVDKLEFEEQTFPQSRLAPAQQHLVSFHCLFIQL